MKFLKIFTLACCILFPGMVLISHAQTTLEWDSVYTINQPYCDGGFYDVISDNQGNVYVTGNMYGEPTCGGATPAVCRLVKMDPSGNIIWDVENTFYNGIIQYHLSGWGLAFDNDSNIYVLSACGVSASGENLHIAKYDTSGNLIWGYNYGYNNFDLNNEAEFKIRSDGNIVVCSNTAGGNTLMIDTAGVFTNLSWPFYEYRDFDIDGIDNLYRISNSTQSSNYFYFSKVNSSGTQQFNFLSHTNVRYYKINVVDNNHIVIYGDSIGGPNFLFMYDSSGTLQWQQPVIAANWFLGSDSSDEIWVVNDVYPSVILSKYDVQGNLLFTKSVILPNADTTASLGDLVFELDSHDNLYIVGNGPGFSYSVLTKITKDGVLVHSNRYDYPPLNPNQWELFLGMDVDNEGNIYLAGELSTFPVVSSHQLVVKYSNPPDVVWPGDADYNLEANNFDILELGLNYGNTGVTRPNASLNWIAQPAVDWLSYSPGGFNSKHSDCNGDGIVSHSDTMAVLLNYGNIHPFRLAQNQNSTSASTPDLFIEFPVGTVLPGSIVTVPVKLGTVSNPATDFYGIAYTFDYDQNKIEANSISVNFASSWLGQDPSAINFAKNFPVTGSTEIAQVSTLHANITGQGTLAEITFQVKPTASGSINLTLGSVTAINNIKDILPVNVVPLLLSTGLSENPGADQFSVYYNATENQVYIQTHSIYTEMKEVVVLNLMGQEMIKPIEFNQSLVIDAASFSVGNYIAQITGSNNQVSRIKFTVTK